VAEASALKGQLIWEHQRHERYSEAESLLLAEAATDPTEPLHSIGLASHFQYYDVDLEKALVHASQAIFKAEEDGKFMYQALGIQARLAIAVRSWDLLNSTLLRLATYEHRPDLADVFPESEFLALIPPDTGTEHAVASYVGRIGYLKSIQYSTIYGARICESDQS
jgi:hypothetical protein